MGFFNKPKKQIELNFHCTKCDSNFSKDSSECQRMVYPIHGNNEMVYYFTTCINCDNKVSVRYS